MLNKIKKKPFSICKILRIIFLFSFWSQYSYSLEFSSNEKNFQNTYKNINLDVNEKNEFNKLTLSNQYLKFTPEENGLIIEPPIFDYSIDPTDDVDMKFGEIIVNKNTVKPFVGQLSQLLGNNKNPTFLSPSTHILMFMAPKGFISSGIFSVINEEGNQFWDTEIQSKYLENGQLMSQKLSPNFFEESASNNSNLSLRDVNDFMMDEDILLIDAPNKIIAELMGKTKKNKFKFCITTKSTSESARFCTPYYKYSQNFKTLKMQPQFGSTEVYLNDKKSKSENQLPLHIDQKLVFLATTKNGFTYEFNTKIVPIYLTDFFLSHSEKYIYFFGHTHFPLQSQIKSFLFLNPKTWTTILQWDQTIGDLRNYWATPVPVTKPQFMFNGTCGGIFKYSLKVSKIPKITERISLAAPVQINTYDDTISLVGSIQTSATLLSSDKTIIKFNDQITTQSKYGSMSLDAVEYLFFWNPKLFHKGNDNIDYIIVKPDATKLSSVQTMSENQIPLQLSHSLQPNIYSEPTEFKAYHNIYRGFNSEVSVRLVGTLTSDLQLNLYPEFAYTYWLENVFNWKNYLLSQQRWGISIKQLSPFNHFSPKNAPALVNLSLKLTTLDLKYRLTPGIWEKDETWGAILGFENSNLNGNQATFLGPGFYWARSMPRLFDHLLSWIPFLNYPKWVDMEFIYYSNSLNTNLRPGSYPNTAINFHGKVLWKKNIFGEAGFGLKTFDYRMAHEEFQLKMIHGTVGLGLNF